MFQENQDERTLVKKMVVHYYTEVLCTVRWCVQRAVQDGDKILICHIYITFKNCSLEPYGSQDLKGFGGNYT